MTQFSEIVQRAKSEYMVLITESFKNFLETKHLYQSIQIDISPILKKVESSCKADTFYGQKTLASFNDFISLPWVTTIGTQSLPLPGPRSDENFVRVNLPTVKVYCDLCKRKEPFNPFTVRFSETQKCVTYPSQENQKVSQVFFLEYQCQSCKGHPEIFVVRKEGYRISLHGRSPMEVYPCPKVIPKNFRKFFSDSVVAFNSGQVLAALFLVRTFVEQFTRFETNATDTQLADDVLSAYMARLPNDFKQRFPSLKKIYSDLSSAIHKAESDDALFTEVQDEIIKHFEARRLFELS
jgi:hypothetical protein